MITATAKNELVSPSAAWPDGMRASLIAALERRLREVRAMLPQLGLPTERLELAAPGNVEESLRLTMVRYWPKIAAGKASEREISEYFRHLQVLASRAESLDDLRFIDAWHNAFECFQQNPPPSGCNADFLEWLRAYSQALSCHLRELTT